MEKKYLNESAVKKFFEMNFNEDPKMHEAEWYLERVPDSFYTNKRSKELIHMSDDNYEDNVSIWTFHTYGMTHGFYCKPSWDWIDPLANYLNGKKVLDVMAGNGLISLCLKHRGIDIDACDRAIGDDNEYCSHRSWEFPTISGEKFIVEQAKKGVIYDTLLMIWPEYNGDESDKKICDIFLRSNPNGEIIFIGEDEGGCTGSAYFFDNYELNWIWELSKHYTPDFGIYDGIFRATKR